MDAPATPECVVTSIARLKVAFPKMQKEFFDMLAERAIANRFTNERLKDAVNFTIDNFQYKELNISDIITYDKKVKLYTYDEVIRMVQKDGLSFDDFIKKEINGIVYRIKKADLSR